MKKILVKQIRSHIGRDPATKRTLAALGLGRIGKARTLASNAAVLGMVKKVEHLLQVSEVKA